jgi:hypothetical protein
MHEPDDRRLDLRRAIERCRECFPSVLVKDELGAVRLDHFSDPKVAANSLESIDVRIQARHDCI